MRVKRLKVSYFHLGGWPAERLPYTRVPPLFLAEGHRCKHGTPTPEPCLKQGQKFIAFLPPHCWAQ